jgi:hypothetical protein
MGKRNGFSTARIDGSSERAATGFSALTTFAAFWVLIPDMFATGWRAGEIRKYQSTGARLSGETNQTPELDFQYERFRLIIDYFFSDGFAVLNGGQLE